MGPDASTQSLLAQMAGSGAPPIHTLPMQQVRGMLVALSRDLDGPRVEVAETRDVTIPVEDGDIRARLYFPAGARGPLPILMHYHGGGYVAGDIDTHDGISRYFCVHANAIVCNVDYRLAPEYPFPAAPEDSYRALCWAAEHAGEWGGDAGRIGVTGDSAGGCLSAVVCLLARDRGGPPIRFQALTYPVTDMGPDADFASRRAFGGGEYFISLQDVDFFTGHYLRNPAVDGLDLRASPIRAPDLAGLPPALVVTAGYDPLRDEGKAYADRLAAAGVPVEYRCFEGTIHGCIAMAGVLDAGREALALIAARLHEALHPV